MSNSKTFTVRHTIAFVPTAGERDREVAVSGTGVAKSRSLLRALQRAKALAHAKLLDSERRCIAQGKTPSQVCVLDDAQVDLNGKYIGIWDERKSKVA